MSRARLFYDPANPVMLRPEDIQRLSPADVQAASDQIDQNMVVLLQRIEENFARCNQVVVERILPAVTQHGENSQRIYESVKFWKPFFEAAAAQRFVDDATEVPEGASVASEDPFPNDNAEQSLSFADMSTASADQTIQDESQPPRKTTVHGNTQPDWQADASLSSLQADFASLGLPRSDYADATVPETARPVQRLRLGDLPPDSPDLPVPEWETIHPSTLRGLPSPTPSSVANSSLPIPSSLSVAAAAATAPGSTLLQKLLSKHMASPRPSKLVPNSSTPGRAGAFLTHDMPQGWDGVADLSKTPLSAFGSPAKRRTDASTGTAGRLKPSAAPTMGPLSEQGHSPAPPSARSFFFSSPAISRTPAKEAGQRMSLDVYHAVMGGGTEDSPFEPPSVMKEWTTRHYTDVGPDENEAPPSPSDGRSFKRVPGSSGADRTLGYSHDQAKSFSLADYGGGTTAKIDDLLAGESSFARVVDDDEGAHRFDTNAQMGDDSYTLDQPGVAEDVLGSGPEMLDHSYLGDEGASEDDLVHGIAPPEDTLFGTVAGQKPNVDRTGGNRSVFEEDTAFGPRAKSSGFAASSQVDGFRVMGAVDHTLHGGQLLESEPFDASPLQNRNRSDM